MSADLFDSPPVVVANLRKGSPPVPADRSPVYIGRGVGNWPGSPLGNPFSLKSYRRAESIARYRAWLMERLAADTPQARELENLKARLEQGERLALLCWCAPLACHGDVVAEILMKDLEPQP